jgi:hypothetical protein
VAVDPDPVGSGVEAVASPFLAGLELGRMTGEVELEAVDGPAEGDKKIAGGNGFGSRLEHAESIRKNVLFYKI